MTADSPTAGPAPTVRAPNDDASAMSSNAMHSAFGLPANTVAATADSSHCPPGPMAGDGNDSQQPPATLAKGKERPKLSLVISPPSPSPSASPSVSHAAAVPNPAIVAVSRSAPTAAAPPQSTPTAKGSISIHRRLSVADDLFDPVVESTVETLAHNANGTTRLNQYLVHKYLGQGSYGTVYQATNLDTNTEYAIKEFSLSFLRRTLWSLIQRHPNGRRSTPVTPTAAASSGAPFFPSLPLPSSSPTPSPSTSSRGRGRGLGLGMSRKTSGRPESSLTLQPSTPADDTLEAAAADAQLRHEIAVLKRLHHPHCVKLHEVLDDPDNDALYMVIDLCPNGPVVKLPSDGLGGAGTGGGPAGASAGGASLSISIMSNTHAPPHTLMPNADAEGGGGGGSRRASCVGSVCSSEGSGVSIELPTRRPSELLLSSSSDDEEDTSMYSRSRRSSSCSSSYSDSDLDSENDTYSPIDPTTGPTTTPLPESQALKYFTDIVLGVEYLHAHGIYHHDLKPANLLLTADDQVKIVDFGLAEMLKKPGKSTISSSSSSHRASSFYGAGSPAFTAPEHCLMSVYVPTAPGSRLASPATSPRLSPASAVPPPPPMAGRSVPTTTLADAPAAASTLAAATDVWSMGVVLYLMLFGRLPFYSPVLIHLYRSIAHDDPPFLTSSSTPISPAAIDLLTGLLAKNPRDRLTLDRIRTHPWLTDHGRIVLPTTAENVAVVEGVSADDVQHAVGRAAQYGAGGGLAAVRFAGRLKRRATVAAGERREREREKDKVAQVRRVAARERGRERGKERRRKWVELGAAAGVGEVGEPERDVPRAAAAKLAALSALMGGAGRGSPMQNEEEEGRGELLPVEPLSPHRLLFADQPVPESQISSSSVVYNPPPPSPPLAEPAPLDSRPTPSVATFASMPLTPPDHPPEPPSSSTVCVGTEPTRRPSPPAAHRLWVRVRTATQGVGWIKWDHSMCPPPTRRASRDADRCLDSVKRDKLTLFDRVRRWFADAKQQWREKRQRRDDGKGAKGNV